MNQHKTFSRKKWKLNMISQNIAQIDVYTYNYSKFTKMDEVIYLML